MNAYHEQAVLSSSFQLGFELQSKLLKRSIIRLIMEREEVQLIGIIQCLQKRSISFSVLFSASSHKDTVCIHKNFKGVEANTEGERARVNECVYEHGSVNCWTLRSLSVTVIRKWTQRTHCETTKRVGQQVGLRPRVFPLAG